MLRNKINQFMEWKGFPRFCYALCFLAVFIISFYAAFPTDALKHRIVREIELISGARAEIKSLTLYPFFSIGIEELNIYKTDTPVTVEQLNLSPSLARLIFSDSVVIPFSARLLGGEAEGEVSYNLRTGRVEKAASTLRSVNIDAVPSLISGSGADNPQITGALSGSFSITLGSNPAGAFNFTAQNLGVSNLKVNQFPLPDFTNLKSNFSGAIENNLTKIEKLEFLGEDLDLLLSGAAPVPWQIRKGAVLDLGLRLWVKGKKLAIIKTFLASHLSSQGDGSLEGKIAGTVGAPKVLKHSSPDI
ncbi:MAG: type II secretion system protein GspN [Deltaproteobacteria bacterium]